MTTLLCGVFLPPLYIVIPVLLLIPYSIFLVIQGIYRFTKSPNPARLLAIGAGLWLVIFVPFAILGSPFLASLPFGTAAGGVPYIILSSPPRSAPGSSDFFFAAIGCLLNVIAILNIFRGFRNLMMGTPSPKQAAPRERNRAGSPPRYEPVFDRSIAVDTSRVAKHLAEAHLRNPAPDLKPAPAEGFGDDGF